MPGAPSGSRPPAPVRIVVTGHDADGTSVFVRDEAVAGETARALPGWAFHKLWGLDAPPTFPDDGAEPAWQAYFPPPGGIRFSLSTIPPEGLEPPADLDPDEGAAEVERVLPGLAAYMEEDEPGMHTTATVDLEVILAGSCILELDGGVERTVSAGDVVVQNGTRHRWRNPGPEPCVMAVFMLGVHHERVD